MSSLLSKSTGVVVKETNPGREGSSHAPGTKETKERDRQTDRQTERQDKPRKRHEKRLIISYLCISHTAVITSYNRFPPRKARSVHFFCMFFSFLTIVEVVVVVEALPEVHARVAETGALVWTYAVRAAVALLVRAPAGHHTPPPEVVDQRGPRRPVQPHLS